MTDREVLLLALHNMVIEHNRSNSSPEELLDHKAQIIGFSNFSNFLDEINSGTKKISIDKYVEIHRRICQIQLPIPDGNYCKFTAHLDNSFSYKSTWIGKDENGRNITIPATVSTDVYIEKLPSINIPRPYVINDLRELLLWSHRWFGTALVRESIAKEYFREFYQK